MQDTRQPFTLVCKKCKHLAMIDTEKETILCTTCMCAHELKFYRLRKKDYLFELKRIE
jgi:hypothetical protein